MDPNKKRVVTAMSGGVDSSVAAALLKEAGYETIGVTMRLWASDQFENEAGYSGRGCCSLSAVEDARRVAGKLGIPFYVLNFKEPFREKVVNYFIGEYRRGRTPNPCIACNRYLKFDILMKKARELEAGHVATGHYARLEYDRSLERYRLKKAADSSKDQSYTLYSLTQKQLAHILFPLGRLYKTEVRDMAARRGLGVAEKPDSQEICFIPDDDYKRFLREETDIAAVPGPILDPDGKYLGTHAGLFNYTVGQRKGLGLAAGRPLYVVELDIQNNALIVGEDKDVFSNALIAEDVNLILIDQLTKPLRVEAKIRYSAEAVPALLIPLAECLVRLEFDVPERAVTPGQAVVFYLEDDVVGGGIIQKALH